MKFISINPSITMIFKPISIHSIRFMHFQATNCKANVRLLRVRVWDVFVVPLFKERKRNKKNKASDWYLCTLPSIHCHIRCTKFHRYTTTTTSKQENRPLYTNTFLPFNRASNFHRCYFFLHNILI